MKIATALSDASFGSAGTFHVWDDFGNIETCQIPETVNTLDKGPDFPSWRRGNFSRTYIFGGHTDNLVFTEHEWLLRVGINAPSGPIVNAVPVENEVGIAASGAAGLTGQCSVALRFLDSLHFRRSPLGAASPAVTLTNQGLTFTNLPLRCVPGDLCVDSLEVWVSVDGGLFRHWATRDLGAATFTVNETATGEAYTDELVQFPKLAFGDMANDRLFAAGDPRHPERVYVSQLGQPEEYGGIFIPTRNGEPVIALKNIGGSTIYVQCPNSSYYIQGFGASDLVMRVLKPKIGGFGQRSIAQVDDIALIPTQRGWYRCDGTSMVPIGSGEWDATWRKCVSNTANRAIYESGFSVTDYVSGVVKFYPVLADVTVKPEIIGLPAVLSAAPVLYAWVINIGGVVPEIGGSGMADLSFDTVPTITTAAAMLYEHGASAGDFYTGDEAGDVKIENQANKADRNSAGDPTHKTFIFHTPQYIAGPVASDQDAFQFTDVVAWLQNEYLAGTLKIYAGNEFAWQYAAVDSSIGTGAPEEYPIAAGYDEPPSTANAAYVPRDRFVKSSLTKSTGSSISVRVTVTQESDDPGPAIPTDNSEPTEQRSQVVFTGWGFIAKDGTDRRVFGHYQSGE